MALTFPLSLSAFINDLWITTDTFDMGESASYGETGGGEIIGVSQGKRLWQGSVSVAPRYHVDQGKGEAILQALRTPGREFYVGDMSRRFPAFDPDGSHLSGRTITIHSVSADRTQLRLTGFGTGFIITPGDYFHFTYDGKRALHRVASSTGADGSSRTGWFDVVPAIRPYTSAGNVSMINTACKAIVVPGSSQLGARSKLLTEGFSFQFRQTLRG